MVGRTKETLWCALPEQGSAELPPRPSAGDLADKPLNSSAAAAIEVYTATVHVAACL